MSSVARGVGLAVAAAIAFGATTPIVAWAGAWIGPWSTAALLYVGAAASALAAGRPSLRRSDLPRIAAVAVVGGALAPALLAWGLHRAGATIGALLLNLEAVFTVVLARVVFREPIGGRVAAAVAMMVAGGAALALDVAHGGDWGLAGAVGVAAATACWAVDNTLTRPLSERDPLAIVAAKGGLGAALTLIAAIVAGEPMPPAWPALALVGCGATGYGLSLRLYMLAQRRIGAGRTGSVFAIAPFVGAALAVAVGDRVPGPWTAVAAGLFAIGVVLHVTERHHHRHAHPPLDHDHPHRHDDGHHTHTHDPPVAGEHAHRHHHDALDHDHDHAPDLHHDHH